MTYNFIFLYFLFYLCSSCSSINHDIAYYDNGNIKYDIESRNGKIDGKAKYWSDEGILINLVHYSNDLFHGEWIDFYPDGKIQHIVSYSYGQKHGEEIWYYQSGKIKSKIIYNYDVIIKELIRWDENGLIIND